MKDFLSIKNVCFEGKCKIGKNTKFFGNCLVKNSIVGNNCTIICSVIENSILKDNITVGPFAHIRPNCLVKNGCKIGNFVEIKNSCIFENTKASHLSYVGDSIVGKNCNIGCGVIVANFDGRTKHLTVVGNNVFVGSNCNLISPLTLASGTFVCAGSTVTKNTNNFDFVIARAKQITKPNKAQGRYQSQK